MQRLRQEGLWVLCRSLNHKTLPTMCYYWEKLKAMVVDAILDFFVWYQDYYQGVERGENGQRTISRKQGVRRWHQRAWRFGCPQNTVIITFCISKGSESILSYYIYKNHKNTSYCLDTLFYNRYNCIGKKKSSRSCPGSSSC